LSGKDVTVPEDEVDDEEEFENEGEGEEDVFDEDLEKNSSVLITGNP
jgi:hypothetical protein